MKPVSWGRAASSRHLPWKRFPGNMLDPTLYTRLPVALLGRRAAPRGSASKHFGQSPKSCQRRALPAEDIEFWVPMKRVSWGGRYHRSVYYGGNSPVIVPDTTIAFLRTIGAATSSPPLVIMESFKCCPMERGKQPLMAGQMHPPRGADGPPSRRPLHPQWDAPTPDHSLA